MLTNKEETMVDFNKAAAEAVPRRALSWGILILGIMVLVRTNFQLVSANYNDTLAGRALDKVNQLDELVLVPVVALARKNATRVLGAEKFVGGDNQDDQATATENPEPPSMAIKEDQHGKVGNNNNNNQQTVSTTGRPQRRNPNKPMLPNLLLAGTQKAGTTAVDGYLNQHNLVCGAKNKKNPKFKYVSSKEPHFFDIDVQLAMGIDWYAAAWKHCNFTKDHRYLIDATPNYQQHPQRIHDAYLEYDPIQLEQLKIIFTVREPVAREMSWYNHWSNSYRIRRKFPNGYTPSFAKDYLPEMIQKRNDKSLKSYYYKWFKEWFTLFDRKNILIISYDEIKYNATRSMQRVQEFLEVPSHKLKKGKSNKIAKKGFKTNKYSTQSANCSMQEEVLTWFQEDTEQFYKLLDDNPGPPQEQRPFPKFQFSCYENPGGFAATTTTTKQ